MEAATRRIPAILNVTGEIAAAEVDEEAGVPYSCFTQLHNSHHSNDTD
jgi:hypothetical protein